MLGRIPDLVSGRPLQRLPVGSRWALEVVLGLALLPLGLMAQTSPGPPTSTALVIEAESKGTDDEESSLVVAREYAFPKTYAWAATDLPQPGSYLSQVRRPPGSFLFGAVVGGLVGHYISSQESNGVTGYYLIPAGALLGGLLFLAADIEFPFSL